MKKSKVNKKTVIIIFSIVIGVLLVSSGIFFVVYNRYDKYSCYQKAGENSKIILENIYEFSYGNKEIKDIERKLIVTYKDKKEFMEAYYDKFFQEEENPPIDVKTDDVELKKTYICDRGLFLNKDNPTVDNYIEILEKTGYSCKKK